MCYSPIHITWDQADDKKCHCKRKDPISKSFKPPFGEGYLIVSALHVSHAIY